jgi:hypothetical protein
MQVPDESLLLAELIEVVQHKRTFRGLKLRCLHDTWRDKAKVSEPITRGLLLAYLNPVSLPEEEGPDSRDDSFKAKSTGHHRRVIDRDDVRQYKIPFSELSQ